MRQVTISACQMRVERIGSFGDFQQQVMGLLDQVPAESDYVVFPELFTVGLLTTYPNYDQLAPSDLIKIDEFTEQYRQLFSKAAQERGQIIIAGSHLERHDDKYFNVCHIFTPDGQEFTHRKTHIFPAEADWYTSEGDDLSVYDIGPAKIGIAICYEAEIPEISRILSLQGAEIIFCPSFTFTEYGFWRVRHCAAARCIENQIYFVHCCTAGEPGYPLPNGFARSSILSPCDTPWSPNGVVAEAYINQNMVITGTVDIDLLYENRETGAAPTFRDRTRRASLYAKYQTILAGN